MRRHGCRLCFVVSWCCAIVRAATIGGQHMWLNWKSIGWQFMPREAVQRSSFSSHIWLRRFSWFEEVKPRISHRGYNFKNSLELNSISLRSKIVRAEIWNDLSLLLLLYFMGKGRNDWIITPCVHIHTVWGGRNVMLGIRFSFPRNKDKCRNLFCLCESVRNALVSSY